MAELWFDGNREIRTAEDWETCGVIAVIIQTIADAGCVPSRRKIYHFETACCRRVWHLLEYPEFRRAVEVSEDVAAGVVTPREIDDIHAMARDRHWANCAERRVNERPPYTDILDPRHYAEVAAVMTSNPVSDVTFYKGVSNKVCCAVGYMGGVIFDDPAHEAESRVLADLFRDVMGNPFRPVRFAADWLTTAVVGVARRMYDDRAFGNMPVLADALEDAGCDDPAVLAHCREPRDHVRGCWVVDLALGRDDPPVLRDIREPVGELPAG